MLEVFDTIMKWITMGVGNDPALILRHRAFGVLVDRNLKECGKKLTTGREGRH